jgi:RNA-directed DNA polymerase
VNWVLDADIRGFFDNLSHEWTMKFIEHRVADHRILRLIRKWLKAGVSEDGQWSETKLGTPQGAVASPLFANVYLHYLFDLWADVWRKKVAKGDVVIVRYADDLVVGFQDRTDAERFLKRSKPEAAGRGKARDLHIPGLHPLLWAAPQERNLHRRADYCESANGREAQSHQG